jgi:hypothetical protein
MPLNFHYAAHTYLDNWVRCDRNARRELDFGRDTPLDDEQACKQIAVVANVYGIARNFSKDSEKEALRYSPVWAALKSFKTRPASEQDAKDCVERLVRELRATYEEGLLSAASKVLWMRFGSPIILYDRYAWNWMCSHGGCSRSGSYADFNDAWRKSFLSRRNDVNDACDSLRGSKALRFLCPGDVTEKEFGEVVSSHWFAERVFDHAIINEIAGVV